MSLFSFKKKSEQPTDIPASTSSRYKVLGTGCTKCDQLTRNVHEALTELGLDNGVEHVSELSRIASYGVMSVPTFVIGDEIVSVGKVLSPNEIKKLIQEHLG